MEDEKTKTEKLKEKKEISWQGKRKKQEINI